MPVSCGSRCYQMGSWESSVSWLPGLPSFLTSHGEGDLRQVKEGKKIEGAAILEDGKTRFLWAFPWIGPRISHRFLDYSLQFPSVDSKVTQMLVLIWAEGTTFLSGSIFSLDCRTSGPNM